MKTGLPGGLMGLLQKLGLKSGGEGVGVSKEGLTAHEGKDPKAAHGKGEALGDGSLLAGLGYTPDDKKTAQKNLAEKANIDRFMKDPDAGPQAPAKSNEAEAERRSAKDDRDRVERDGADKQSLREEVRREERQDEARHQSLQEAKEQREQRETREAKEHEREDQEREKDDDDRHATPWVQEELEREEEQKKRQGLYEKDTLGEDARCKGELEDGTRCLRRPILGTHYCREHGLSWRPIGPTRA